MARTSVATYAFTGTDGTAPVGFTQVRDITFGSTAQIRTNKLAGNFANASGTGLEPHACVYRWTGAGTFTDDSYAQIVVSGFGPNVGETRRCGVVLRCGTGTDTAASFYVAYVCDDDAGSGSSVNIMKMTAADGNYEGAVLYNGRQTWANGDVLSFEASGSSSVLLTLFKNGVATAATATDSSATLSGGTPGFYIASHWSDVDIRGDDWVGGTLSAAAAAGRRRLLLGVGA